MFRKTYLGRIGLLILICLQADPARTETIVSCLPVAECSPQWCFNNPRDDASLESTACQANLRKSCTPMLGCSSFWCVLVKDDHGLPYGESPVCYREILKPCEPRSDCTPQWCKRPRLQLRLEQRTNTGARYFIIREWSIPDETFACLAAILKAVQK